MIAASTPSDMAVSGGSRYHAGSTRSRCRRHDHGFCDHRHTRLSSAVKVGHDVRSVLVLCEPSPELLDPGRTFRTDHSGEDVAPGLLGELATDATLPCLA